MSWLDEVEKRLAARPVRRITHLEPLRQAGVLVPLLVASGELWVVLTRRVESRPEHAGRIAFPGGAAKPGDADEVATALRKASEELGFPESSVIVLGHLDDQVDSRGFVVSPVVGALPQDVELAPGCAEVSDVLTLPVSFLAGPDLVEEQVIGRGRNRVTSPLLHYRGQQVGGATASIVVDLIERLTGAPLAVP